MRFSIIICTKNRAASLARTLQCLQDLETAGGHEVLVIDNGSTDDTQAVVQAAARSSRFPVRYERCDIRGKSAALNAGIAAAAGEVLAFTDDDALVAANWLTSFDKTFRAKTADWVFGPVQPHWEAGRPDWYTREFDGVFALMDLGGTGFQADSSTPAFFGVNCAATSTALRATGGYRTDLGPRTNDGGGGEDTEMFNRALELGQRIFYEPAAMVTHVIPAGRTNKQFHRRRLFGGRANNFRLLQSTRIDSPRILGVPRFYYVYALSHAANYVTAAIRGDQPGRFRRELDLIRFAGLFQQGLVRLLNTDITEIIGASAITGLFSASASKKQQS